MEKEVLIELKNIINILTIIGFLTMASGVMYALWGSVINADEFSEPTIINE